MGQRKVVIIMGSKSDNEIAGKVQEVLEEFGLENETAVLSAHRTPNKVRAFVAKAEAGGADVIIAIAGLAAHLPGVIASQTVLPVIGVPVDTGPLRGLDALYSIVQMPPGIPVACVGIGNAKNAALLAIQICAVLEKGLRDKMAAYRQQFGDDAC